jgi:hypothetical protein
MFTDPQSVTINAVATSLPRIASGNQLGTFSSTDGTVVESIAHTSSGKSKRFRRTLRLTQTKIAADSYNPTINTQSTQSIYVVVDVPATGFSLTEQQYLAAAFTAYLSASSNAKLFQLLNGEA